MTGTPSSGPPEQVPHDEPSPEKLALLRAVAQAHDEWVAAHLPGNPMDPTTSAARAQATSGFSDYNQHHLDLDATSDMEDDFHARVQRILKENREMDGDGS